MHVVVCGRVDEFRSAMRLLVGSLSPSIAISEAETLEEAVDCVPTADLFLVDLESFPGSTAASLPVLAGLARVIALHDLPCEACPTVGQALPITLVKRSAPYDELVVLLRYLLPLAPDVQVSARS